jgi:broad specificity phosphatase PhoE
VKIELLNDGEVPMNIYLIRHGEKEDDSKNHQTLGLTQKGLIQADLLGQRLSRYGIEKIYSSDLIRAIQTSNAINKYLNVEIIIRNELREIDMGKCQDGWDNMQERYPEFMQAFSKHEIDIPYPNGECGKDVWERSIKIINKIISDKYENNAVVAHGGTIRALLSGFLGLGQERRFTIGAPFENCSISVVKYDKKSNRFYVHTVNDYAHLENLDSVFQ